ncbi:MAG: ribonuclease III [Oscillospiraceae bacterium]|nr:ribonuclease III [Oscillospiraceae bacterium]
MTDHFNPQLSPEDVGAISSIGLAHMGDAVYEILVRAWLCAHGKATGKGLHRATVALVCAPRQAQLSQIILPLLSEEEQSVFRRGRNANVHSIPAHASRAEYQQATALEALFGYLYLLGRKDRINQLFDAMMGGEQ